ncbi:aminotransferase class V-fold PLP-dependent enzyme [Paenibacillus sp. CC-CFT747]|nr:aminotransferase class V-fold PLP-dependent enzyme [Paenibacillus sp. CC-CFT747]
MFTSGGTESNNLAVKGAALQYRERGKHLITSEIEHASVYESFKQLESLGFEVTYLRADETGTIRAEDIRGLCGRTPYLSASCTSTMKQAESSQPLKSAKC